MVEALADVMKKGLILVMNNRVKFITKDIANRRTIYEVTDEFEDCKHTIIFETLLGRTRINCDCSNCTRFCNENKICYSIWACLKIHEMRVLKIR